jgi:hypothetical protein
MYLNVYKRNSHELITKLYHERALRALTGLRVEVSQVSNPIHLPMPEDDH